MRKSKAINPKILSDISVFSSALPILAFLFNKQNWTERSKWVCFFILIASILADVINTYLAKLQVNNLWVINLYIIIDSVLVFYFYYWKFRRNKQVTRIIFATLAILVASWTYHNLITNNFHNIDSWTNGIETLAIIVFSMLFFYDQLLRPQTYFVYSTSIFWIVAGILLYKAGTFFLILYFDTLEESEKASFATIFIINSAFLILRNLFFTIAFLIHSRNNRKNVSKTAFPSV